MNQQEIDEKYMRRCLQLAANGRQNARPNPMVGAVIVVGDKESSRIIGEGYHVRCGEGHAEVNAFASVRKEDEPLLRESTIYVSLEPCSHYGKTPPCADLIIKKGVRRVVVGCVDEFAKVQGRGIRKLREAGIEVTVGVLEEECRWLNRRFFTFHRLHRPYIILKWAQTADGFLDDHFQPLSISTPLTKMLVHRLRAEEDAIVVGRTTWERECPRLTVREWTGKDPVRFVLSSSLQGSATENVSSHSPFMFVDSIEALLTACYERQLQSLVVEGGCDTLQRFIDRGIWDEIRVETGSVTSSEGTRSPVIPPQLKQHRVEHNGDNTVTYYLNQQ